MSYLAKPAQIIANRNYIIREFILPGAPNEVNLPSKKLVVPFQQMIATEHSLADGEVFADVELHVREMIMTNSMGRFNRHMKGIKLASGGNVVAAGAASK